MKKDHLRIPENALELRADFIRPAFYWLEEVYSAEYTGYKRIRDLCTEEIWKRYFLWAPDFDEHREMKLLKKAGFELRKRIVARLRPNFFKKGKMNDKLKEIEEKTERANSSRTKAASTESSAYQS